MTNRTEAATLWADLYASVFARRRHEKLWAAMAALTTGEKWSIDEDAERIITEFLEKRSAHGEDYDSAAVRATGKRLLDKMRPLNNGEDVNGGSNG
jgi:hypothetical protein